MSLVKSTVPVVSQLVESVNRSLSSTSLSSLGDQILHRLQPTGKAEAMSTYIDSIVAAMVEGELKVKSHFLLNQCGDPKHLDCGTPASNVKLCNKLAAQAYRYLEHYKKSTGQPSFAKELRSEYPQFEWSVITTIERSTTDQRPEDPFTWVREADSDGKAITWSQSHATDVSRRLLGRDELLHRGEASSRGLRYGLLRCCRSDENGGWMRMIVMWTEAKNVTDNRENILYAVLQNLLINSEKFASKTPAMNEGLDSNRLNGSLARASLSEASLARTLQELMQLKMDTGYRAALMQIAAAKLKSAPDFSLTEDDVNDLMSLLEQTNDAQDATVRDDDGVLLALFEVAMGKLVKSGKNNSVADALPWTMDRMKDAVLDTVPLSFLQELRFSKGIVLFDLATVDGVPFPRVYPQGAFENNVPTMVSQKDSCFFFWPSGTANKLEL